MLAAKPTKRDSTSPVEPVYCWAAPPWKVVAINCVAVGVPTYDTFRASVVVVDAGAVFDEIVRAVLLAETVEVMDVLVALTVGAEPVDAGAATVAFTKIGRGVAIEEADVDERTSELSGDMADEREAASEEAACKAETLAKPASIAE